MKKLAEMWKQYLEQNPLNYGEEDSVLDVLYQNYTEYGSPDNEKICSLFAELRKRVDLPPKEYDSVFYVVSDLCLEYGRLAFREGMRLGMLLMCEINDE